MSADNPEADADVSKARMRIVVIAIAVVLVGAGILGFVFGDFGGTPAETATESSDAKPLRYEAKKGLCGDFDLARYEDVVGEQPKAADETVTDTSDSAQISCLLRVENVDDRDLRFHSIRVIAQAFESDAAAGEDYENTLAADNLDESDTDPMEGPWQAAVVYAGAASGGNYGLDVHDGNATVRVVQALDPVEAVPAEDARELMVDLAEQALTAMRR